MPNTKYQVNLSLDGKHSVRVQSDDPAAVTEALVWAKKTHAQLVRLERVQANDSVVATEAALLAQPIVEEGAAPICAVHDVPMARVNGRKGPFWSCHEKMSDGSWCSFKPR